MIGCDGSVMMCVMFGCDGSVMMLRVMMICVSDIGV